MIVIGMALIGLAGCRTLEDAMNQTIGALPSGGGAQPSLPLPSASPSAENCGDAKKFMAKYKAAAKENERAAKNKYDMNWCRFSGTITTIASYRYEIHSYPAVTLDKNLSCVTAHPDHLRSNFKTPNPSEVERSEKMLDSLRSGQKITVVGQVDLQVYRSNSAYTTLRLPVTNCRITEVDGKPVR
ncbi:MAG: hypothetical protein LBF93_01960 [Zoogloeaceae bacterium]|jgi:hypothetical protein|nr:hypothetical protein [Zoogloeaceae bacterium]